MRWVRQQIMRNGIFQHILEEHICLTLLQVILIDLIDAIIGENPGLQSLLSHVFSRNVHIPSQKILLNLVVFACYSKLNVMLRSRRVYNESKENKLKTCME